MSLTYLIYRPETLNQSLGCVYEYEPSAMKIFRLPAEAQQLKEFVAQARAEAVDKPWIKDLQITIVAGGQVLQAGSDQWIDAQGVLYEGV